MGSYTIKKVSQKDDGDRAMDCTVDRNVIVRRLGSLHLLKARCPDHITVVATLPLPSHKMTDLTLVPHLLRAELIHLSSNEKEPNAHLSV